MPGLVPSERRRGPPRVPQEVLSGRKSAMMALAEAVKEPDRPFPLDKDMLSLIDQLIASYDVGR